MTEEQMICTTVRIYRYLSERKQCDGREMFRDLKLTVNEDTVICMALSVELIRVRRGAQALAVKAA
jgi:hypothetical protein